MQCSEIAAGKGCDTASCCDDRAAQDNPDQAALASGGVGDARDCDRDVVVLPARARMWVAATGREDRPRA